MFCKSIVSPSGSLSNFEDLKGVTEQLVAVTFFMFLVAMNARALQPKWIFQWQSYLYFVFVF